MGSLGGHGRMCKTRGENGRFFFIFPLFYIANEEIQQKTEQENSKLAYYFEFSHSGFPHSQDKRAGISKIFLLFFTLFLYIPRCLKCTGLVKVNKLKRRIKSK